MNLNILNDTESADYLNMLQALGFSIELQEPTHETNCIDHVMV